MSGEKAKREERSERQRRLAEALRENLKKRRDQQRGRRGPGGADNREMPSAQPDPDRDSP